MCGAERVAAKRADVAGCEHVLAAAGAAAVVHDDAVVDVQPGFRSQLHLGLDAEPGDDDLRASNQLGARALAGADVDALLVIEAGQERRQIGRKDPARDHRFREEHRHLSAIHSEGRGDLRADETSADDDEVVAFRIRQARNRR